MAAQSLLAKLGMRMATLGSAASLALAFPLTEGDQSMTAHTAVSRIGFYADRTPGAEKAATVVMGTEQFSVGTDNVTLRQQAGAPATPADGMVWVTSAGMFCRAGGVTSGPFAAAGGTIGGTIAANQVAYGSGANAIQGSNNLQYNGTFLNNAGYYQSTSASGYGFYQTAARNEVMGARFENTSTGTLAYSSIEAFSDTAKIAIQAFSSTFASVPAFQNSGVIAMLNATGSLYFYTNGAVRQTIDPTGLVTMSNDLTVNGETTTGSGLTYGATYHGLTVRDAAAQRVLVGYKSGGVSTGSIPAQIIWTDTVGTSGSLGIAARDINGSVISLHAGTGAPQVASFGASATSIFTSLTVGNGVPATSVTLSAGAVTAGVGFGVGVAPTSSLPFNATGSSNGDIAAQVTNTSNGTSASANFYAKNDAGKVSQLLMLGSGYTTNGVLVANAGGLIANGAGGLFLSGQLGPVTFSASTSNSFAERVRVSTAGNLLIGTTADTGITGAGGLSVANTTVAASAIAGAVVVGNGTAATNVSIGGGKVWAGGGAMIGSAALATNATDGFLYTVSCAGTPVGTPTAITGLNPVVVDSTNNLLYFYSGGAWRSTSGSGAIGGSIAVNQVAFGSGSNTIQGSAKITFTTTNGLVVNLASSGADNLTIGNTAGDSLTSGTQNTLLGTNAGTALTTTSGATAVGYNALAACTVADNVAMGSGAADAVTSSLRIVAVGKDALGAATSGADDSTAVGYNALLLATGARNSAFGSQAGNALVGATDGAFFGSSAGGSVTSGIQNTAIGSGALGSITTTANNTAVGYNALSSSTGADNTGVGRNAAVGSTLNNNTVIGSGAIISTINTNDCVAIGKGATVQSGGASIGIGSGVSVTTANTMVCGSSSFPINTVYFGKGSSNAAPTAYAISGTNGSGSNIGGAYLQIQGGQGTGTGVGGGISFRTSSAGTSGSSLNSVTDRWQITGDGRTEWNGISNTNAPAVSGGGSGAIYFNSTSNSFKASLNGGAYYDMTSSAPAGFTTLNGNLTATTGDIVCATVGNGYKVKQGTNATAGVATLVGGTVVVNTNKVTANSMIYVTAQALGTVAIPSGYGITARVAGTSFTITASAATDTSVIAWWIVEPAP